jgi:hypothetical protein
MFGRGNLSAREAFAARVSVSRALAVDGLCQRERELMLAYPSLSGEDQALTNAAIGYGAA